MQLETDNMNEKSNGRRYSAEFDFPDICRHQPACPSSVLRTVSRSSYGREDLLSLNRMRGSKSKRKAKGRKGSSRDRAWTHEGGLQVDRGDEDAEKPRYRVTQEIDEKNRRLRFKQELIKQKKGFVRKMGRKLTFRDVLSVDSAPPSNDTTSDTAEEASARQTQPRGSKDIAQRLRMMVSMNRGANREVASPDEDEGSEGDKAEDYEMDGSPHSSGGENLQTKDMSIEGGISDYAVEDEEVQSDDESEEGTGDCFRQFFSFDWKHLPVERPRPSLVATVEDMEIYGSLSQTIAMPSKTTRLGDIPGLPKLWRSRRNEPLSRLSAALLPYLVSYGDVLFEALSQENERELLTSWLLHCLVHILRAR